VDRTKYLNFCRECVMVCKKGTNGILKNVPDRLRIVYKGIEYYPLSYELAFFDDGSVNHIAIIHDLKANSVCHVPLGSVKEKEN